MKNNKLFKFLFIILIGITLITFFEQNSFADSDFVGDIKTKFNNSVDNSDASNKLQKFGSSIINITQVIGIGVAILMLVFLSIQWLYASPSGKADLAKNIRYYILGAIFIFSAMGLLEIVKKFALTTTNNIK